MCFVIKFSYKLNRFLQKFIIKSDDSQKISLDNLCSREFNLIDFVLNVRDILSCIYLVFNIQMDVRNLVIVFGSILIKKKDDDMIFIVRDMLD